MPKRRPADDRGIYCRPPATDRCPGSHRWGACRSSSGHRPKILSFAERIGRWPNSLPAAAGRRPLHDFYDVVQGRENPAMTCQCQKVDIGEKSWDRRTIYKACDVPFSTTCNDPILQKSSGWETLHLPMSICGSTWWALHGTLGFSACEYL